MLTGTTLRCPPSWWALTKLRTTPDLVVLNVNLPDGNGFDLCRTLIERFAGLRIIMLTARAEELDVVVGLDSGAVDYVTKPFRLAELKARVRAQTRVASSAATKGTATGSGTALGDSDVVSIDAVRLDAGSRRVWVEGTEVTMRMKEFDLLERLMRDAGKVVTREDLMRDVWDAHWFGSTKTLDVHIAALRRRFGETAEGSSRISTVRGVGFRFERSP